MAVRRAAVASLSLMPDVSYGLQMKTGGMSQKAWAVNPAMACAPALIVDPTVIGKNLVIATGVTVTATNFVVTSDVATVPVKPAAAAGRALYQATLWVIDPLNPIPVRPFDTNAFIAL